MALALGARTAASATAVTSITTGSLTTTSGSVVALSGSWATEAFVSFTDSKTNTWTQIQTELGPSPTTRAYYAQNLSGGSAHTFTLTITAVGEPSIWVVEATGTVTSGALDQSGRQADTISPFDSPGVTTTQADEFLWGFISGDSLNNPTTHTAGNSFTLLDEVTNGASFWPGATAYRIVAATGTYNSDFTQSGSSNTRVWIATFKAAGGGGGAVDVWRVRPSVNWSMTSTRGQKRSAWSDDAGIRDPSRDAREGYRTWSK